jgi:hypothetical protein
VIQSGYDPRSYHGMSGSWRTSTMHHARYGPTHCWCGRSRNFSTIPYGVSTELNMFNVHGKGVLKSVETHNNFYGASWQIVAAQSVNSYSCSGANCYISLEPLLSRLSALSPEPPLVESTPCRTSGVARPGDETLMGIPRNPIHLVLQ